MWTKSVLCTLAVAAVAVPAAGCFVEPSRPGSAGGAPVVRKIASAWYSVEATPSPGMSANNYSVPTAGIHDGDLVVFIGNIDNGNSSTWPLPTAAFQQLAQTNYGTDGQTLFAAWTIAHNEPAAYAQPYNGSLNSAASAITLLAVTGFDPAHPIAATPPTIGSTYEEPVVLASAGITTTAPESLVLFAGGADWPTADATATFGPPAGFDVLDASGDRGGLTFQWTTQLVAKTVVAAPGPTGPHMGSITPAPANSGMAWTLEIAIPPAP